MLAEPSGEIAIPILAVFIEDDDKCADFAGKLAKFADIELAVMPIANRLPQIDSV